MSKQKSLPIINNQIKCFDTHSKHKVCCQKQNCKNHINDVSNQNCVIIAAQKGPHTLQNIGKIYGLTRMRICQIEKSIIQKLKNLIVV
jgi:DNA-directed RNA polymerase sigma subunit (sigma70/sigma32)